MKDGVYRLGELVATKSESIILYSLHFYDGTVWIIGENDLDKNEGLTCGTTERSPEGQDPLKS